MSTAVVSSGPAVESDRESRLKLIPKSDYGNPKPLGSVLSRDEELAAYCVALFEKEPFWIVAAPDIGPACTQRAKSLL